MKTIWKYPSPMQDSVTLYVLEGSTFLSVHEQMGNICLWFLVDDTNATKSRHFVIRGTGHPVPQHNLVFLGTVLLHNGAIVFHVFEEKEI